MGWWRRVLLSFFGLHPHRHPRVRVVFVFGPDLTAESVGTPDYNQFGISLWSEVLAVKELPVGKKVSVSVKFVDKAGNPAKTDGAPQWATDNPSLLSVVPSEDRLSCFVSPLGVLGTAKVQVTADADLGEGVKSIIGVAEFEIVAGEASTVEVEVGEPEDA